MQLTRNQKFAALVALAVIGYFGYQWLKPNPIFRNSIEWQLGNACGDQGGTWNSKVIVKQDFTGDGVGDFLINHKGFTCTDGSKSRFCDGPLACLVLIYVQGRPGPYRLKAEFYDILMRIGPENPPIIDGAHQMGRVYQLQWNGTKFERIKDITP